MLSKSLLLIQEKSLHVLNINDQNLKNNPKSGGKEKAQRRNWGGARPKHGGPFGGRTFAPPERNQRDHNTTDQDDDLDDVDADEDANGDEDGDGDADADGDESNMNSELLNSSLYLEKIMSLQIKMIASRVS